MKKRILAILLTVMVVASVLPVSVFAEGTSENVAKIGDTEYATLAEAVAAATEGQTVEIITAGEYSVPTPLTSVTIKGTVDGVIFNAVGSGNIAAAVNVTFQNITFNMGNGGYHGFQHNGGIRFEECVFNGLFNSYGTEYYYNCTFNQTTVEYCMWVYGGDTITYDTCTFNTCGKVLNVYNENNGPHTLVVKDCTFKNESNPVKKPAVLIKSKCGNAELEYDVTISGNNTLVGNWPSETSVYGDGNVKTNGLWDVEGDGAKIKVTVGNAQVYPASQEEPTPVKNDVVKLQVTENTEKGITGEVVQQVSANTAVTGFVDTNLSNVYTGEGSGNFTVQFTLQDATPAEDNAPQLTYHVVPTLNDAAISNDQINGKVTFRLPLTAAFNDIKVVKVIHHAASGNEEAFYAVQGEADAKYVEITTTSFSEFDVLGTALDEVPAAAAARIGDTEYASLGEALAAAKSSDIVKVLKNIETTDNLTIGDFVILDLNHKTVTTTGTITNNGSIRLYNENADIIDYLLYNVPGAYAAGEELKLPTDDAPDYIVPNGTFVTAKAGDMPAYQQLDVGAFDGGLAWNKDVPAGMQLDVTYDLTLGGNILGAKSEGVKPTTVTANHFELSDNITIGGNNGEGEASLVIQSIHYGEDDPYTEEDNVIGSFRANSKTITINRSGKLVISSDVTGFDENVLVSGVESLVICKSEDEENGTIIYTIGKAAQTAPMKNEGYTVDRENGKVIPKEGYEIRAEIGKFAAKELPLRFGVPYYVRKAETETLKASPETEFSVVGYFCKYTETVKLTEDGAYGLKLNGSDHGEFTFSKNGNGWSIRNGDGRYLAVQDGKLAYSETAFAWTYRNGAFSVSEKTTQKNTGYWFGWIYIPGWGSKTVTATYYLSTVEDGQKLSACCVCAELYEEVIGAHEWGCRIDCKDGANHTHQCKNCGEWETEAHSYDETTHECVCGAYDPSAESGVKVDVKCTTRTDKQYVGWWLWGYYKNVTVYTYDIKTEADGVEVSEVEYSTDGRRYTRGSIVTSDKKLNNIKIRVTDDNGMVYNYTYDGVNVTEN